MRCIVCKRSGDGKDRHLVHKFPKKLDTRLKWLLSIGQPMELAEGDILDKANYGVCSMHFSDNDYPILCNYNRGETYKRCLSHSALPTLNAIFDRKWPEFKRPKPKIIDQALESLPVVLSKDKVAQYLNLHTYSKKPMSSSPYVMKLARDNVLNMPSTSYGPKMLPVRCIIVMTSAGTPFAPNMPTGATLTTVQNEVPPVADINNNNSFIESGSLVSGF